MGKRLRGGEIGQLYKGGGGKWQARRLLLIIPPSEVEWVREAERPILCRERKQA